MPIDFSNRLEWSDIERGLRIEVLGNQHALVILVDHFRTPDIEVTAILVIGQEPSRLEDDDADEHHDDERDNQDAKRAIHHQLGQAARVTQLVDVKIFLAQFRRVYLFRVSLPLVLIRTNLFSILALFFYLSYKIK